MANRASSSAMNSQQQYAVIEQLLTRAGYDHEAHIEERPKSGSGSFVFSMLNFSLNERQLAGEDDHHSTGFEGPFGDGERRRRIGGMAAGSSSLYGGVAGSVGGGLMHSPVTPGSSSHKRYAQTVRSSTSSLLSLGRQKTEHPVMILPHYNSPYEALYYNQPDVTHFIGKDLKIGTVCVSVREGQDAMHFLVRTILKFANIDIPHSYRSTPKFEECRSFYQKKDDMLPLLHVALHHCFESIPEPEVNRHQVARHQFSTDHSVFVLDEPSWLQNPCYISSVVGRLEEIRQENFTHVLKNLEAQMRPAALTIDVVVPDQELLQETESARFWTFFNGLGDQIETENYLLQATRIAMDLPAMIVGDKTEEQRSDALQELVETEISYNKRMQDLVNVYLREARCAVTALNPPLSKYEVQVIFSNIEKIVAVSSNFIKDLRDYQSGSLQNGCLGDICRKNLQVMECYKQYLMRYKRAQETHSALNKKSAGYRALQENCAQTNSIQTLSNLLIEPTQRIVKYPLLFKAILSGTNRDSADVNGLRDAAELAAQIAYMEKAKPEQRAEILFNLRGIIENCPDSLLSQNRSVVAYLDGYETNLLTGERGRPITLILFSDKIMIVRRPRDASGDTLFQLKEDDEARRRREKEDKEKQERQKRVWRDSKREGVVETDTGGMRPPTRSNITAGFQILRKDWKFMGWMDILKLKVSVVEQTDPEGLFCITTRDHQETKDDPWETTRGILPEVLDSRDPFISKLYETLALAKAATVFCGAERTSRLHVAELELFCNVFTETQYRDIQCKGDIALFYSSSTSAPVDIMPFTRLPLFVGMIQATESGLRAILRSKASLNGVGQLVTTSSDPNPPMNMDAFQIHISELVANLQWTIYSFDPYQSSQLHFSKLYMDTDYLFKTANTLSRSSSLRTKGLQKIRDATGSTTFSGRSSSTLQHRYSGSFSPLASPSDVDSVPISPCNGMVGRSPSIISGNVNHRYNSSSSNSSGASVPSPSAPNKRFSMPVMKNRQHNDNTSTYDITESDNSSAHYHALSVPVPLQPQEHVRASTLKNSVSVMSRLIPGARRKKGHLSSMVFGTGVK